MTTIINVECEHHTNEQITSLEQLISFLRQHGKSMIELTVDE